MLKVAVSKPSEHVDLLRTEWIRRHDPFKDRVNAP
jgi:hypothetical protein